MRRGRITLHYWGGWIRTSDLLINSVESLGSPRFPVIAGESLCYRNLLIEIPASSCRLRLRDCWVIASPIAGDETWPSRDLPSAP